MTNILSPHLIWLQVLVGVISTVISCSLIGGLLFFILRLMNKKIDGKVDIIQCGEKHKSIDKDLSRGEEQFKSLGEKIEALSGKQSTTNEILAGIKERIDLHLGKTGKDPGG